MLFCILNNNVYNIITNDTSSYNKLYSIDVYIRCVRKNYYYICKRYSYDELTERSSKVNGIKHETFQILEISIYLLKSYPRKFLHKHNS